MGGMGLLLTEKFADAEDVVRHLHAAHVEALFVALEAGEVLEGDLARVAGLEILRFGGATAEGQREILAGFEDRYGFK